MNCPKCGRKQYYTCGNPFCLCQNIPKGELAQINLHGGEVQSCPYCRFTRHIDFWSDLEMQQVYEEQQAQAVLIKT